MAKVLRCRDVGIDCDFVARADSEEEILKKAAEHAAATHDMGNEINPFPSSLSPAPGINIPQLAIIISSWP